MQRRNFLKTAGAIAGASAFGSLPFSALAQKKISFKFDSYISETAGPSALDQWFLTELEKRSGGQVDIRRYWSASLNKDRKSTRLNSSHVRISYAVFCLKKKTNNGPITLQAAT